MLGTGRPFPATFPRYASSATAAPPLKSASSFRPCRETRMSDLRVSSACSFEMSTISALASLHSDGIPAASPSHQMEALPQAAAPPDVPAGGEAQPDPREQE